MGKSGSDHRLRNAAIVGGGLGIVGGAAGLLKTEASFARRNIGVTDERPPSPEGVYGVELPGEPLRLLVLGDSAAVGYGMVQALDTPAALFGAGLSQIAEQPVDVTMRAVVGAQSADLDAQITSALDFAPQVAAIIVGTNDITHGVGVRAASRSLGQAVARLHESGCEVVVGTCPDLGTVRPLPQPLRFLARLLSRRLAAAQMVSTVETGGRAVALADLLGPDFDQAPDELFGADRFHPSDAGYAGLVAAMLPSVAAAVGVWDEDDEAVGFPEGRVLPISFAASQAAKVGGAEVSGSEPHGRGRGPRGRWASLRLR